MNDNSRHEILIGMRVDDEDGYAQYRAGMTPILESMGGFFRYDMRVSELLKGDAPDPFNRLFLMSFPDQATSERFFADSGYLRVRETHFDGAVRSYALIAQFSHAAP